MPTKNPPYIWRFFYWEGCRIEGPLEFLSQSEVEVGEQFDTILDQMNPAQSFMGTMVVVSVQPISRYFMLLLQAVEDIAIEYLCAVGLVESLDQSVLRGFAYDGCGYQ